HSARRGWAWACLVELAVGLLLVYTGAARAQVNTADLSGQVVDPNGLPVPHAKVTVENRATGATRSAEADDNARYRFVGLPPGRYKLTVEGGKGLAKLENPEIVLTIGQAAEFDAHLQLQSVAEVVKVEESTELIETARTSVAETVDQRRINNLPINGRNYVNFTLLTSQAQRDSAPSIGAAPTSGINFGGQRARSNEVSVDGADAVDNSVNGIRATVSQEAVQEFQIILSNYMPEFGRATGGVVNIVTKGGSNELHGNVFGFLRHKSIQARNPFSVNVDPTTGALVPVKQAYTRAQAGATLGGPIQKDKTFYFFSYETTRRQETGFTNIGSASPGTGPFGLVSLGVPGLPFQVTPAQKAFILPLLASSDPNLRALGQTYAAVAGSASSVALSGIDPGVVSGAGPGARFPLPVPCIANTATPIPCGSSGQGLAPLPASFVALNSLRGNYPISEGTSLWSGRIDHQWNQRNNSFVRASVSPSLVTGIQVNAQNQNFGQNAGSRTSLQQSRDLALVGQHVTSITNSLFNEARFQFARRGLHYGFSQLPGGSGPGVQITGFAFFGREPFSTVDRIERRFQWTDNLTWIKGHHTFKVGGDINLVQLRSKKAQIFELNFGGVINFGVLDATPILSAAGAGPGLAALPPGTVVPGLNALQSYGLGLPTSFIQGIGTSARPFDNKAFAVFLQDSWKIHPRLTLNYGVRYDLELTPLFPAGTAVNAAAEAALGVVEGIPHDKNNVAPRFALAWDPWGNGKTVLRAGYGIFYDHPLLAVAFNSFTAEGAKSVQLISGGGAPSALPYPTNPSVLNGATIFQGVLNDPLNLTCYLANQQRFDPKPGSGNSTCPTSIFVNQAFLAAGIPVPILPFTLAVNKNFEYGYAQQANLTVERQFAKDYKFSLSYTYTHGLKLYRPRDINSTDPRLLAVNFRNAVAAGLSFSNPLTVTAPASNIPPTAPSSSNPLGACGVTVIAAQALGTLTGCPGVLASLNGQFIGTAAFFNFYRPSGPNPSFAGLAGGYANQVALAGLAGFPTGFPGVPVPLGGVDNQESSGNSVYHGLTFNFSKRFGHHFEFLSSYTWSHAIDDSTDLQTLLEPQEERKPNLERSNSTFDQRHRWVVSGVLDSPYKRSDSGFWRKFLADFAVAPILELSSGRPYTVLTGTDFRLDLGANTGRPSVGSSGVTSLFVPGVFFTLPTVCDAAVQLPPAPVPIPPAVPISPPAGCTGNLGRNTFVRPNFRQFDLRVSRKFFFGEKTNLEFITDMFNLLNRNNKADVNPLCDLSSPTGTCTAGQPSASLDPRQFQFALKFNW
ncbi:MAG TPA: TonB-dependent receptor, partial [Candidatus Acidoferrales bacterium]|nr:TonB-dependent receptor [Candidatus Acidoferrales bacterium]